MAAFVKLLRQKIYNYARARCDGVLNPQPATNSHLPVGTSQHPQPKHREGLWFTRRSSELCCPWFSPGVLQGNLGLQSSLCLLSIIINLENVINLAKIINLNIVINLTILISVHSPPPGQGCSWWLAPICYQVAPNIWDWICGRWEIACMGLGASFLCCLRRGKLHQFLTLQAPGGSKCTVKVQS